MSACKRLRPLMGALAEGEAGPAEAMRVAAHLHDCTSCRIVLARERRLAEMLEQELPDPLPVGEEFVLAVMEVLPAKLPVRTARERRLRLVRLALVAGLLLGGGRLLGITVPTLGDPGSAGGWVGGCAG